jgi:N-acetylneuraminic acid mutarotase
VVGDTLYVVGGWNLQGEEQTVWHDHALSIDLRDPDAAWVKIPTPFKRRALSVGHQGEKLYVVGGMQEKGGPTRKVSVYDIDQQEWSEGPDLPTGGTMEGFGSSCFNIGGRLVVSTYSGNVLRLADAADDWKKIGELETGRFFHRLLPYSGDKFVIVGGANMEIGKLLDVAVMDVK